MKPQIFQLTASKIDYVKEYYYWKALQKISSILYEE